MTGYRWWTVFRWSVTTPGHWEQGVKLGPLTLARFSWFDGPRWHVSILGYRVFDSALRRPRWMFPR